MTDNLSDIMRWGGFKIGHRFKVASFYEIPEANHITFDGNAYHHNNCFEDRTRFYVDVYCELTIRGFETVDGERMAVVRADWPERPSGDKSPTGHIFMIPVATLETWPAIMEKMNRHHERRNDLARKYKR